MLIVGDEKKNIREIRDRGAKAEGYQVSRKRATVKTRDELDRRSSTTADTYLLQFGYPFHDNQITNSLIKGIITQVTRVRQMVVTPFCRGRLLQDANCRRAAKFFVAMN